jgi:hypothetical protein
MKIRPGMDTAFISAALCVWENEGGALAPAARSRDRLSASTGVKEERVAEKPAPARIDMPIS